MQKIYQIDKKDFGYSSAIDELYALIGNPSFHSFDTCSARRFISEGSVDVYKYDAITKDEFVYDKTIKRTAFEQFVLYTEDDTFTSSVITPTRDLFISESLSNQYQFISESLDADPYIFTSDYERITILEEMGSHDLITEAMGSTSASADFLLADTDNVRVFESDFGRSIDMCGSLSAIGSTKVVYSLLHIDDAIRTEEGVVEIHDVSRPDSLIYAIYPKDVTVTS